MVLPVSNTYTISLALDKLIGFIEQERKLPKEVRFKVRLLCNKLRPINIYIKESQSRPHGDSKLTKEIVQQLRNATHDAEDTIDGYILQVEKRERMSPLGKGLNYLSSHRMTVGDVSDKIDKLNIEFEEIHKYLKTYETSGGGGDADTHKTTSSSSSDDVEVSEEDRVGFVEETETLVNQLIDHEDPQLRVVFIVGMAGSGKSTLAKMVKKHGSVKDHFDCRIWVNAEGGTCDVLLQIIKGVFQEEAKHTVLCQKLKEKLNNVVLQDEAVLILQEVHKMTVEEVNAEVLGIFERLEETQVSNGFKAQSELNELVEAYNARWTALLNNSTVEEMDHNELKKRLSLSGIVRNKRYLLVMDNVREPQILDNLKDALPDRSMGSRILITTCKKGFPRYPNSFTYFIPKLNADESWRLFCKMAFRGSSSLCPHNYQDKGKITVEGCEGLPLALVVLGKLLEERRNKKQSLTNISIFDGRERWRHKIAQSYDHLDQNLKHCFFYLGVFPRNTDISAKQ